MMKKNFLKIGAGILTLSLTFCMSAATVLAADTIEPYTYTVRLHAANQGTFSTRDFVKVVEGPGVVEMTGAGTIEVSGLTKESSVTMVPQSEGAVNLSEDKYYVRGVRESGRDNSDALERQAIESVTEDAEYVVAYGVKGQMVQYTVTFKDEEGNDLAPSQTYEGNVGDKPVVAFQYIEGWQPQAYNLTKSLVEDPAENVFPFVYRQIPEGEENPAAPTEPGGEAAGGETAAAGGGGEAGAGDEAGAAGGEAGAGAAEGAAAGEDEGLVAAPDEAVPQDLVDLDEEETPLANMDLSNDGGTIIGSNAVRVGVLAAAVAALIGLGALLFHLKRKDAGEDD